MKSGFVTILGRPNVGKSTLVNAVIGQKIAITSKKPQTTRNSIRGIYTCEEGQIVFTDTPGMISEARNKLGEYMQKSAKSAAGDADLILYLVEPSSYIGSEDQKILKMLRRAACPVFLLINKTDTIPKEHLLPIIESYRTEAEFAEIFPMSALRGKEIPDLIDLIFRYLPEGPMYYDEESITDRSQRELCAEMIREKALHALNEEIPHGLAVVIDTMSPEERENGKTVTRIEATIVCEKNSHKSIIIGKNGSMLKKIGTNARYEIEKMLGEKVFLSLFVKVRRDWRDDLSRVRDFGYDLRDLEK